MQKNIVAQSTKWSAIGELLSKLISPLVNIALARILAPEVFGLVATFMLVTSFADVFTDAGFQKYLVQHDFKDSKGRVNATNVAFWSNFSFSMLFWLIIIVFRDQVAEFVGSSGHGIEISVLSFQIPLHAFSSIQMALFRRDFKFKELVPIKVIASLSPIVVTIPFAFVLRNAWAIIIGTLVKETIDVILLTRKSEWKPSLFFSFSILKQMIGECLWLMGDSFVVWLTAYSGTFIVSRYLSSYYIGLYKTGITTISSYISLVSTITAPVLFSALSRVQSDRKEVKKQFFKFQRLALYLLLPIGAFSFVFRNMITTILLGEQWIEVSGLIGLVGLTLSIGIGTAQYNSVYFRSVGRPSLALLSQLVYVVVMILVLLFYVDKSFAELCIARGLLGVAYILISTITIWIAEDISPLMTLKHNVASVAATLASALIAECVLPLTSQNIVLQVICFIGSLLIYLVILYAIPFSRNDIKSILPILYKGKGNKQIKGE